MKTSIVKVTMDNIAEHPQAICYINPKHELFHKKVDWLREQFANGYMFIHCLWINGKKHIRQGLGSILIKEVERDAKKNKLGVAVITSDKSFIATREIFLKNGYSIVSESGKEQLIAKQFKKGSLPYINNWEHELKKYKGLAIIYSKQCPWVPRFIEEVKPILKKEKLEPKIFELETAEQAQKGPSIYCIFNLIYDGKLLADRYISTTRFLNIVNKEIKPHIQAQN